MTKSAPERIDLVVTEPGIVRTIRLEDPAAVRVLTALLEHRGKARVRVATAA